MVFTGMIRFRSHFVIQIIKFIPLGFVWGLIQGSKGIRQLLDIIKLCGLLLIDFKNNHNSKIHEEFLLKNYIFVVLFLFNRGIIKHFGYIFTKGV